MEPQGLARMNVVSVAELATLCEEQPPKGLKPLGLTALQTKELVALMQNPEGGAGTSGGAGGQGNKLALLGQSPGGGPSASAGTAQVSPELRRLLTAGKLGSVIEGLNRMGCLSCDELAALCEEQPPKGLKPLGLTVLQTKELVDLLTNPQNPKYYINLFVY